MRTFKMGDGRAIPAIGFGTWQIPAGKVCYDAVSAALKAGYRHIDTAIGYGNETSVGEAIRDSGIDRSQIFVTSKIQGDTKTYEGAKREIDESLARLNTGYVDLMLIHCAKPWDEYYGLSHKTYDQENLAVWKAMAEAQKEGRIKSIGVSNFGPKALANIVNHSDVKPAVDQIRFFIGCNGLEAWTIDYCLKHDILVEAYSPLNTGDLLKDATIASMAKKYRKTLAQLAIAYCLNKGFVALPKSVHPDYIASNLDSDFAISKADMAYLDGLKYTGEFRIPD